MLNKIAKSLKGSTFLAGIVPVVIALTTTAVSIATYSG
jgi:hypothetical protein